MRASSTASPETIEIPRAEWTRQAASVPSAGWRAIRAAARHIRRVARGTGAAALSPCAWRALGDGRFGTAVVPLYDRVGCYVPGGRRTLSRCRHRSLGSQMTGHSGPTRPGCGGCTIAMCPRVEAHGCWRAAMKPASIGSISSAALARDRGDGAIGHHASVPRVDKIVGPGNRWVSAAKSIVAGDCAIDFYAGLDRDSDCVEDRHGGVDCRGSHRAGGARSRRPCDLRHTEPPSREECGAMRRGHGPGGRAGARGAGASWRHRS